MHPNSRPADGAAILRPATLLFLRDIIVLTLLAMLPAAMFPSCQGQSASVVEAQAAALVSTTAQKVAAVNTAIPASIKAEIVSLIAAHPEAQADLETVANAIESAAGAGTYVTNSAVVINAVLPWLEQLPNAGAFFTGLQVVLNGVTALEPLTSAGLTEIGELIKSYAA